MHDPCSGRSPVAQACRASVVEELLELRNRVSSTLAIIPAPSSCVNASFLHDLCAYNRQRNTTWRFTEGQYRVEYIALPLVALLASKNAPKASPPPADGAEDMASCNLRQTRLSLEARAVQLQKMRTHSVAGLARRRAQIPGRKGGTHSLGVCLIRRQALTWLLRSGCS